MDVLPDGSLRVVPAPELELLRAAEPFVAAPGRARFRCRTTLPALVVTGDAANVTGWELVPPTHG